MEYAEEKPKLRYLLMRFLPYILLIAFLSASCESKTNPNDARIYPNRWFYVSIALQKDKDVETIARLVKTASEHGLNGMVLAAGLDRLDLQSPDYLRRLAEVRRVCKENNIEIIPMIFSVGYGSAVLSHDRNLAAGLPVQDALFVAGGGEAHLVPDPPVEMKNGGFEEYRNDVFAGFRFNDKPGRVSFADNEVFKGGRASIRFENFGHYRHGHGRLMQEVRVQRYRCYELSFWVKTQDLEPGTSLRLLVLNGRERNLAPWELRVPSTSDWQEVSMGFNSLDNDDVMIYAGVWEGESGKFWIDEMKMREVGLLNILRRPGTPLIVKSEKTGFVYEEGRDFSYVKDSDLTFRFDHDPPVIKLTKESRIEEGERLRVSYYHGTTVNRWQVSVCISEPKLYDIWQEQAKLINEYLAPTKYFLSMDEVREGGTCRACEERGLTMAEMLGDCITKACKIIHGVNPDAEIFAWSDMLDPNHNAHDNYYLAEGDFTGSWKYVPKDLGIACWYYTKREKSLKFFSSLGFKTLAGAYYDGESLTTSKRWLESLDRTPGACGIMYTTWEDKYKLLAPFGDLVSQRGE
jgi:hypothetical protein